MLADHGAVGCWQNRDDTSCQASPNTTARISEEVERNNGTLILHVGDISYAVGNGYLWDLHGAEIQKMSAIAPYMVSVGNHEYDHEGTAGRDPSGAPPNGWHPSWGNMGSDSGGECGVPTSQRFRSPTHGTGNGVFWYSFNYGSIHVLTMSSEHDYTPGSPQRQWIDKDLESIDRAVTPWIIVTTHRPFYSSEKYYGDWAVALNMQRYLEQTLLTAGVDVVLAGHYHGVERTCPVFNRTCCNPGQKCPVHIVAGHAGIGLDSGGWFPAPWSLFRNEDRHGYLRVSVDGPSMLLEVMDSSTGETIDSTTLIH